VSEQLSVGRNGFAHEQVSGVQRARILAAMVDVASELGAGHATITRVVARSGVSRRTFYEIFNDREDCFLAAFEDTIARATRYTLDGYDPTVGWAERLRTALTGLLTFLACEPGAGRLLVVEALGAGPGALKRRQRVLAEMTAVVDAGRMEVKTGQDPPPPLTAEAIVGGAFSLIHSRMTDGKNSPLIELTGPIMAMIVSPYLGSSAARRELARPIPTTPNSDHETLTDPLRGLDMRLTYRTIRVLLAISDLDQPGLHPSNRHIGDAAGIRDQGQTSKLLARLQQLQLITNTTHNHTKGEANAWTLTKRGNEIQKTLSPTPSRQVASAP
jgi:AcrR family transcriptional regulator